MPLVDIIILTKDEEKNLPFALSSLAGLDARIFVVDSGSTDRTCSIAREHGCEVVSHDFETHARQMNWALDKLPLAGEWVMRLDADERLSEELAAELSQRLATMPPDTTALMLKRRVYFWGRWIRHGGYYPIWLLRLWRSGTARCENRAMDEQMVVSHGNIGRLENDIIDENRKGLAFWIDKHNRFSDSEATAVLEQNAALSASHSGGPISRKRWLKDNLYERSPRFWRAFLYWAFRYFILLGFLDGQAGFVFHFMQGFWYRLVVDAKLFERGLRDR